VADISARPEELSDVAKRYERHASEVGHLYTTLLEALNRAGSCWGSHETGQNFARQYVPAAVSALRTFREAAGGLAGTGTDVGTWANVYQAAREADGASANQLASLAE
jgi:hypothetical protein